MSGSTRHRPEANGSGRKHDSDALVKDVAHSIGARATAAGEAMETWLGRFSWRLPLGRSALRIRVFMVVVSLFVVVCVGRAFQLQAIDAEAFADVAASKMQSTHELPATRGSITDRNGVVLASTEPAMMITVDADMVVTNGADKRYPMSERKREEAKAAPQAIAEILARHTDGRATKYLPILQKKRDDGKYSRYEILAKQVPASDWTEIQAEMRAGMDGDGKRPWYGLFATSDPLRTYPNRTLASNVIGFVNGDGKGAAGLEGLLEEELDGEPGQSIFEASRYGRIPLGTNVLTPPTDGDNYTLTLDNDLQWTAEQALAEGMATPW